MKSCIKGHSIWKAETHCSKEMLHASEVADGSGEGKVSRALLS